MTRVVRTTGYAPEFDAKVVDGEKSESKFTRLLTATGDTFEVKSDVKSRTTYNVAVEYEQHGVKSGIATTKAAWHAIETYENTYIVLPTARLKEFARAALRLAGNVGTPMGDNGNVGALVPVAWLVPSGGVSMEDEVLLQRIAAETFQPPALKDAA